MQYFTSKILDFRENNKLKIISLNANVLNSYKLFETNILFLYALH